ncbi:hypothetical protein ACWENQ_23505 [Nonomuraea sp. NPDC004354]
MNLASPSSFQRAGCILILGVVTAACAQEPAKPFDAQVSVVEVAPGGRALTLHASGIQQSDGTICTVVEQAEAIESPTGVTVRVSLRPACPESSELQVGTGVDHAVPVALKKPLAKRKVFSRTGQEIQACPTTAGSFIETIRRCKEKPR